MPAEVRRDGALCSLAAPVLLLGFVLFLLWLLLMRMSFGLSPGQA